MDSLAITPTKTKLGERRRRPLAAEATIASLSTESSDILNRLLEPENTRHPLSFLDRGVGVHRNPNSSSKPPFKDGKVMPGTLITPRPSFVTEVPPEQQSNGHLDSKISVISRPRSPGVIGPPLARSMSMDERSAFLDGLGELSRAPPATVYALHAHELRQIAESATRLGFYTGIVLPESAEEGLLILGRDLWAVQNLLAKLSRDSHPSGIRAMAGGAVAGAVATFTGLALA